MNVRRITALGLLAAALASCGRGTDPLAAAVRTKIVALNASLPAKIQGLDIKRETMSKQLAAARASYVDAVDLYSLRRDDLLHATLEIARFRPQADFRSARFRSGIVNLIGGSEPRTFRLGSENVSVSTGTKQKLVTWFHDRYFFVLAVREDYKPWRALVRAALELNP